jgi:hypothetical protein
MYENAYASLTIRKQLDERVEREVDPDVQEQMRKCIRMGLHLGERRYTGIVTPLFPEGVDPKRRDKFRQILDVSLHEKRTQ